MAMGCEGYKTTLVEHSTGERELWKASGQCSKNSAREDDCCKSQGVEIDWFGKVVNVVVEIGIIRVGKMGYANTETREYMECEPG